MRRPYTVVRSWPHLASDLAAHDRPDLLILDVDPAVAGWSAPADAVARGVTLAEATLRPITGSGAVVWASNSTRIPDEHGGPRLRRTPTGSAMITGARKPLLRRLSQHLGDALPGRAVVCGDQWLIDGILAWRLNARFVLWDDDRPSPWWVKGQSALGQPVRHALYRRSR